VKHDLLATVRPRQEHLEAARRLVQRQVVRDDEARIDLARLNPFQQRPQVLLHVALARADGERAVHHRAIGVLSALAAGARNMA
jgi:hypothetical protein